MKVLEDEVTRVISGSEYVSAYVELVPTKVSRQIYEVILFSIPKRVYSIGQ
jgi:hypothetical protein